MHFACKILIFLLTFNMVSCGKDDTRLEEVSGIQGQKAAEKQIEEENKNLAAKARVMELDLKKQTDYYEALEGDYAGEVIMRGQKSMIELTIQAENMPVPHDRIRTLEEIAMDLNQISLTIQIKYFAPGSDIAPEFCQMLKVKPNIKKGLLSLSSDGCSNLYQLSISKNPSNTRDAPQESTTYSQEVYTSSVTPVPYLKGFLIPGSTPGKFEIFLKRINENSEGK